ncbi:MAG: biotin--[acetyl-CoA-carboxylase] ligase [Candidatus Levybacteria bacterium]|nr:biotin--[acetyl-CoA-carboxylase] ligase [Candidatus Levybacteria bacterium]
MMSIYQETASRPPYGDSYDRIYLGETLQALGYDFTYIPQTLSTMDYARGFGRLPAVILTDHQTKGIGRERRVWHDTVGCSVLLSAAVSIPDSKIGVFSDLVGLHVYNAVRDISRNSGVKIKWPNDIVHQDRKLGGILVENRYDERQYVGTTVGIGINVHYAEQELKQYDVDYEATSADIVAGMPLSRQELVIAILRGILPLTSLVGTLADESPEMERLNEQWRQASSFLYQNIVIFSDTTHKTGRVIDTKIGEGILLASGNQREWINRFESDMKVRKQ